MNNLQKAGKKISINTLISWGASIVIIGLTFKILHWRGGEWMIGIGLLVEALLFFLMGYASLSEHEETVKTPPQRPAERPLDDVLSTSIDQQSIERLRNSFEHFNKTVESVNSVTGSVDATQKMLKEMEQATLEVQELRKNLAELNNVYRAQLDAYRKA